MKFVQQIKPGIKSWLRSFLWAFAFVLIVKGCVFDLSYVPSPSMKATLSEGDCFLLNKLAYGPRIIRTPLSIPFVNGKWYSTWIQLPYIRVFGTPGVERNDVLVFNFPMDDQKPVDHREQFIKRCVALPGDSVKLQNARLYVNGKLTADSLYCIYNYLLKLKEEENDSALLQKFGLSTDGRISDEGHFSFFLPDTMARRIALHPGVLEVKKQLENTGNYDEMVFPFREKYPWNADNFGSLYVPKEGDTLKIDTANFCFYERLIRVYENNQLELRNGKVFINGDSSGNYVVQMNYYFVLGDSRHDSRDSRHWGFLPEDHIIAKASCVLFSYNRSGGGFRKGRWFKGIE